MHKHLAQNIVENTTGEAFIEGDWFPNPLPENIFLDEMAYPDTSYSFTTFFRKSGWLFIRICKWQLWTWNIFNRKKW